MCRFVSNNAAKTLSLLYVGLLHLLSVIFRCTTKNTCVQVFSWLRIDLWGLVAAHVSISALHGVKIIVQQISEMIFQKCIYALSLSVPLQPVKFCHLSIVYFRRFYSCFGIVSIKVSQICNLKTSWSHEKQSKRNEMLLQWQCCAGQGFLPLWKHHEACS